MFSVILCYPHCRLVLSNVSTLHAQFVDCSPKFRAVSLTEERLCARAPVCMITTAHSSPPMIYDERQTMILFSPNRRCCCVTISAHKRMPLPLLLTIVSAALDGWNSSADGDNDLLTLLLMPTLRFEMIDDEHTITICGAVLAGPSLIVPPRQKYHLIPICATPPPNHHSPPHR